MKHLFADPEMSVGINPHLATLCAAASALELKYAGLENTLGIWGGFRFRHKTTSSYSSHLRPVHACEN
jgi:hypothetical protein